MHLNLTKPVLLYGDEETRENEENKQRKWEIKEHMDTRRKTNKKLKRTTIDRK
jgi:hypothetical protein